MKNGLELLAPAQNKECALAAIKYGADAVYIGASEFGARNKAANSLEDIKEVINYAHRFEARVYVTINTILNDVEILEAKKLIEKVYLIGADAVIIQDMGILELAHRGELPPIQIFASTQCDNRTLEKVQFFEKVGVSRVILARELSCTQIEHICKNTKIEVETFIHGALCVSYSGQCYLSYVHGGRSANRGECAQACRKKYTLVDENGNVLLKDKHLLNLKDFNATKYIDELVKAGVKSFKIEGRMKDVNYVKNVVAHYRKLLNKYPGSSYGKVEFDFEPNAQKSFNRGFSEYFLGNSEEISNFDTPKSLGEELGCVIDIKKDCFSIKTDKKVNPQDGLCMLINGELHGCLVNSVNENTIYPNKMPNLTKNTTIYRNLDFEFEKKLTHSKTTRKLGVKFIVYTDRLQAEDEGGNVVEVEFEANETANDREKMVQSFISQLQKTGESDFYTLGIETSKGALPFLPVSKVNELRRKVFELLIEKRLNNYMRKIQKPVKPAQYPAIKGDYRLNISNSFAKTFMQKCNCEIQEFSLESGMQVKDREFMRCKYCIKKTLGKCESKDRLYLVDDKQRRLKLEFDCKNCEMIVS